MGDRDDLAADAVIGIARLARVTERALARAWRATNAVVTSLGWVLAIVGAAALIVGSLLGLREIQAVGIAVVVLALIAAGVLFGRPRLTLTLAAVQRRVAVGDPAAVSVRAANTSRLPTTPMTVELPIGAGLVDVTVPGLAPGGHHDDSVPIPTGHRGVLDVGPLRGVRQDPVGLVRREIVWGERLQVIVHPRTVAIPSTSTGLVRDLEGQATSDLAPVDIAFHAIRDYQPGDEPRTVHWKSTAKTGALMVRQFEDSRRAHLVVCLGIAMDEYAADEEFELAVSVAASLGVRAVRDGRDVSVVVSQQTPDFARRAVIGVNALPTVSPTRLLDAFSAVSRADSCLSIADVARLVGDLTAGISVAFLVVGSSVGLAALRRAAARLPLGVEAIAVICEPEAQPRRVQIPGLTVLTVGFLDDLRVALHRSATS